jgi:fatty acid synthase, animal type
MCPQLEKFVVYSSGASGFGIGKQTNYGWANSGAEMICEKRRRDGLPATVIQFGAVGDVGLAAVLSKGNTAATFGTMERAKVSLMSWSKYFFNIIIIAAGSSQQSIYSCMEVLDQLLTREMDDCITSSIVVSKDDGKSNDESTMLNSLLKTLGIYNLSNVDLNSTLEERGIDSLTMAALRQSFYDYYGVQLSQEEAKQLTIDKVLQIAKDFQPIDWWNPKT